MRSLTINIGLRTEINQHMTDINNRLSAIDLSVPGGRFVIASDPNGNISPTAQRSCRLIPIPYVTSSRGGLEAIAAAPEQVAYGASLRLFVETAG